MNHSSPYSRTLAVLLISGFAAAVLTAAPTSSFAPAPSSPAAAFSSTGQTVAVKSEIVFTPIPKAGKKYDIDADTYLIYEFNEKPKMGTAFLKIQIFNRKSDKITPFTIFGRSDMPSMRGAHDSGSVEFKLNKKNDYLMPVNIVMPGDWEVRITIQKDGKPVYYGSITFDV
jgi:hypothetical protein